jgi:hypothetical protein
MTLAWLTCFLLPLTFALLAPLPSCGQSGQQDARSLTFTECEGVGDCGTWTFSGGRGIAHWTNGETADLSMRGGESIDGKTIIIHRNDVAGSKKGYWADYVGTMEEGRIGGTFTSSWQGTKDTGNWYALPGISLTPPTSFHACSAGNCVTYALIDGEYKNYTNLPNQHDEVRTLNIRMFTKASVLFEETDTGSYPLTAIWNGRVTVGSNNVSEGIIQFTTWGGKVVTNGKLWPYRMTWGNAIDSEPGNGPDGGTVQVQQANPGGMTTDQVLELWNIIEHGIRDYVQHESNVTNSNR